MRMTLHTAALYDRDPRTLRTSAEMLALRGLHPDVESAEAALDAVRESRTPERPTQRRSWRVWVHSAYLMLVFGGFMSPSTAKEEGRDPPRRRPVPVDRRSNRVHRLRRPCAPHGRGELAWRPRGARRAVARDRDRRDRDSKVEAAGRRGNLGHRQRNGRPGFQASR